MSTYLGKLGQLVELRCPSALTVGQAERYTLERTLEGVAKAQAIPLQPREWSVDILTAKPAEVAALMGFASGEWGLGPFVWVTPEATVTNLLTPAQSTCDPSTVFTAGVTAAGPLSLGADGWAGRSFVNPTPATEFYFGSQAAPVLPGDSVTVSAYLVGAGAAVRVRWVNAAGAFISTDTSAGTGVAGVSKRISLTAIAPPSAAGAQVQAVSTTQAARPALTWTPELYPWADGQGCPKAIVRSASRDVLISLKNATRGQLADLSFKISEVG